MIYLHHLQTELWQNFMNVDILKEAGKIQQKVLIMKRVPSPEAQ